jgi:hypothetical protein
MIANINGVGNLHGPNAPIKILREGCRLLAMLTGWVGGSAKYVTVLKSLAEAIEDERSVDV